jgi:hypothetical protein
MKAIAAFSFSTDKDRVDALQEYQLAVTLSKDAVKSTEDLISDASFLTHFLLLVHEVSNPNAFDFTLLTFFHRSQLLKNLIGDNISLRCCRFQAFVAKSSEANVILSWCGGSA